MFGIDMGTLAKEWLCYNQLKLVNYCVALRISYLPIILIIRSKFTKTRKIYNFFEVHDLFAKNQTAIQKRTELLYLLTVFRKLVGKVSPTWWSSYVLLARIEFSGNLPFSAFFCMPQELAVDQLMLRSVVINFQGWVYNLQCFSTHVIELNSFCNSNIINMCVLWDAAYNLCTYLWWENYVDITC